MPVTEWTKERMLERVVRYEELVPCVAAFIDAKTPGSHLKENFTIIGPGVSENPEQHVHIREPHGFNIGAARQPGGIKNSPHSHETAEGFMVFRGTWRFYWGVEGQDGDIVLEKGDTIALPTAIFRGFENIGQESGFLLCVLGGDNPGRVTWAPQVIQDARGHGLVLLEDGRLVDTTKGQTVPEGAKEALPLNQEEVARFRQLSRAEMSHFVIHFQDLKSGQATLTANGIPGFEGELFELVNPTKIVAVLPSEFPWPHNFRLLAAHALKGVGSERYCFDTPEVFIPLTGQWLFSWGEVGHEEEFILNPGDTFTCPVGVLHRFENVSTEEGYMYIVLGGDRPTQARLSTKEVQATSV